MKTAHLTSILVILSFLVASCSQSNEAAFEVGKQAYDRGDYSRALEMWLPLANKGHAEAQYRIGGMYTAGKGVRRDHAESTRWYRRAAEQGHAGAQGSLGFAYSFGVGAREDLVLGYKWALLAAMQEDPVSQTMLESMRNRLTPVQAREAKELAREWIARRR